MLIQAQEEGGIHEEPSEEPKKEPHLGEQKGGDTNSAVRISRVSSGAVVAAVVLGCGSLVLWRWSLQRTHFQGLSTTRIANLEDCMAEGTEGALF